jgi:hypothetical protein
LGRALHQQGESERAVLSRIIFPYPYQVEVSKLRQQLDEAHLAWAKEWKARQADFKIENIRFVHDPNWNKRVFSIQAAHDGEVWFWRATRVLMTSGVLSI